MPDVWGVDAVASGDRLHVFALGADGTVFHRRQVGAAESFEGQWTAVTSGLVPVAALSWAPGRIDLVGWASEQGTVTHLWSRDGGGAWAEEVIGSGFAAPPAVASWGVDRLDLVAVRNGEVQHKYSDGSKWNPADQEWGSLGGASSTYRVDGVGLAAWEPGGRPGLDVVALVGDEIHHRWMREGRWNPPSSPSGSPWESLGNDFGYLDPFPMAGIRSPRAVGSGSTLHVFGFRNNLTQLRHKWSAGERWVPGQLQWVDVGAAVEPSIASWSPDRVDVVAPGDGGGIGHRWFDGDRWNPGGWEDLSTDEVRPIGGPALVTRGPGRLDLLAVNAGGIWWRRFPSATNPNTWGRWVWAGIPKPSAVPTEG